MPMEIVARTTEQRVLEEALSSGRPEFIAVYGRRRVGKTYLIRNFFAPRARLFHITGVAGAPTAQQLWNFSREFADVFGPVDYARPATWEQAFDDLRRAVARHDHGRQVIFFDELPWLATRRSGFAHAFSHLWNRYLSNDPSVLLVVCGSAASWIISNIIDARGGLYSRLTRQLRLAPFSLGDTERYLRARGVELDRKQVVEIYMALGGVPAYLDKVNPGRSSAQVVGDLCFSGAGDSLYGEFARLYHSLFQHADRHLAVVRALAASRYGLSRQELVEAADMASGSVQRRILRELLEAGFISRTLQFGNTAKQAIYRLTDEYSHFYLHWLEKRGGGAARPADYWLGVQQSPAWRAWSGLAFENVCANHAAAIARALGIAGIQHSFHTWRHAATDGADEEVSGAQVDLVVARADRCINLCEVKFTDGPLTVTKALANELIRKRRVFAEATKTNRTLLTTLLTMEGAVRNDQYLRAVQVQLTADDLFA